MINEQLDMWKNYVNPKERKKEMDRTYDLQIGAMIHKHSQNTSKLDQAIAARIQFQSHVRNHSTLRGGINGVESGLSPAAV